MKTCAAFVLAAAAACSACADIATITGDTTGKPVYNRALSGNPPPGLSMVGTAVHYDIIEIQTDTTALYTFVISEAATDYDTFMHLYGPGGFNPASALSNCIIGDDDSGPGSNSAFATNMVAGQSYFVAVSGFDNDDFGGYILQIRGDGKITVVPAPSAMAMLGGAGLLGARRRRR